MSATRLPAERKSPPVPAIVHEVLGTPGRPLDDDARAFMEPRFGHDFSRVRVHDDAAAGRSAAAVGAIAYTAGAHVVLGPGGDDISTPVRRTVLAHELSHVADGLQHLRSSVRPTAISRPDDTHERHASMAAERLARGFDLGAPLTTSAADVSAQLHRQTHAPPAEGGTIMDTLRFVVNDAGFAQGSKTPPNPGTYSKKDAVRFGTWTHNRQLRAAVERAQALKMPGADRLVEGVRVNGSTGVVLGVNVVPGGSAGDLNFDLVVLKEGQHLVVGDTLQSKAVMTGDAKYGGLSTNRAQANFARANGLVHLDLGAGDFKSRATTATPPVGSSKPPPRGGGQSGAPPQAAPASVGPGPAGAAPATRSDLAPAKAAAAPAMKASKAPPAPSLSAFAVPAPTVLAPAVTKPPVPAPTAAAGGGAISAEARAIAREAAVQIKLNQRLVRAGALLGAAARVYGAITAITSAIDAIRSAQNKLAGQGFVLLSEIRWARDTEGTARQLRDECLARSNELTPMGWLFLKAVAEPRAAARAFWTIGNWKAPSTELDYQLRQRIPKLRAARDEAIAKEKYANEILNDPHKMAALAMLGLGSGLQAEIFKLSQDWQDIRSALVGAVVTLEEAHQFVQDDLVFLNSWEATMLRYAEKGPMFGLPAGDPED